MRLRLRIELQNDAQAALGTVTWTPQGGAFSSSAEIQSVFNRLQDFLNSPELRRRVNMLRTLADQEISVTAPPDITINT